RADSPQLVVEQADPIATKSGVNAQVRILSGARDPRQAREALAFVPHGEVIALIVLSTKDPKSWKTDYAAFDEAVAGFQLFTCDTPGLRVGCKARRATQDQFEAGVRQARANEAKPEWKAYSGPFFQRVGPILGQAMGECFHEPSSDAGFTVVFT